MRRTTHEKKPGRTPFSSAHHANELTALAAPAAIAPARAVKHAPARNTLAKSDAGATRANLKNAYEAFKRASQKPGSDAMASPSPSEQWPYRPYAAFV